MVFCLFASIAAFLSWVLGLSFIQIRRSSVWLNAGIMAAVAAIMSWLLLHYNLTFVLPGAFLGLFLLEAAAIHLQCHSSFGSCAIAFCLAFGAFPHSLLCAPWPSPKRAFPCLSSAAA